MAHRELFISEHRYISNIVWKHSGLRPETIGLVVREYYAPSRTSSKVRFNNDYFLDVSPDERMKPGRKKALVAPILPNTLGVDVFVTVDAETLQPLMTELLGGEAFSPSYFKEHIEVVEGRLAELSHPVNLRRSSYCRMFVIENDICFLVFPKESCPTMRGRTELLLADTNSSIQCGFDAAGLVYVDGWIRTSVAATEKKIEALPR